MKLIIAGSRNITDYATLLNAIVEFGYFEKGIENIEVVSGLAKGPDTMGLHFATTHGLKIHPFPALWDDLNAPGAVIKTNKRGKKFNSKAGPDRNERMGDFADELLALWDGESSGTKHMIEYMRSLGKPVHVKIIGKE